LPKLSGYSGLRFYMGGFELRYLCHVVYFAGIASTGSPNFRDTYSRAVRVRR